MTLSLELGFRVLGARPSQKTGPCCIVHFMGISYNFLCQETPHVPKNICHVVSLNANPLIAIVHNIRILIILKRKVSINHGSTLLGNDHFV